ncbi:hotdog fold thioesterase [Actinokineospora bangkokensis]|uniref:Aromatic compound degradation protein PaaI n=1 Tax=Actinokineospora bangkokensis TaxID=1193682 RepID=A0A1Q9LR59_9PSEU|nr:hotdog fold thioesterase [Actinokineospora bangkokensis]OLR94502.1 aromatic compound degradation protein PaaI [Actinokineospora bangkokensis]
MTSTADPSKLPGVLPEVADQLLADKLGIEVTDWTKDRLVATMPVAGNLQPYGLLHGGANAVLAETLGSIGAALNAPEGKVVVGLELSCTHHRAARDGVVTAVCTPLHLGRSTSTFEIVVTDGAGKRTCTARLTCVAVDKAPGAR